jgi:hypothetical protein
MKAQLILTSLLLATLLPFAAGAGDLAVRLLVDTAADAPTFADCAITIPAGSNVEAVLNQALADGCILEWHCTDYGSDCFVDSIDFVPGQGAFYWAYYIDREYALQGIRGTTVQAGAEYHFALDQWVVFPSPL